MNALSGLILILLLLSGCGEYMVERVAFHPVPLADDDYELLDDRIREVEFHSADHIRLHAFYIPYPGSEKLVIYLHGNYGNSLHRIYDAWELAKTGVNVLLPSYRGYGRSTGHPSEHGVYADAIAALEYSVYVMGYSEHNLFLYGRSLGSAIAVEAAQGRTLGGLILVSPFTSGEDVMEAAGAGWMRWLVTSEPFNSVTKVDQLDLPALFIHGERDRVVPLRLGRQLYERYHSPNKCFSIIPAAGHNDLVAVAGYSYWSRVSQFIETPSRVVQQCTENSAAVAASAAHWGGDHPLYSRAR